MKIFNYIKIIMKKIHTPSLVLDTPDNYYKDLIASEKIDNLINNMPHDLSEIEKAYYVYIELGKIIKEDPKFRFSNKSQKKKWYDNKIDNEYYGVCKSISELYVSILRDKRVGISAESFKKYPKINIGHIDTILNINGKYYVADLMRDLSRIKTSGRVNNFCVDLTRKTGDHQRDEYNKFYLETLKRFYGKIDCLTREEIEQLDKKLGYSFFVPKIPGEQRGVYADDTIELLKKEMNDPEAFKSYVLHDEEVPEEDYLKYKLRYIFENINKLTDYNGDMEYSDRIRYYMKIFMKILSKDEFSRLHSYVATIKDDFSNIISILEIKGPNKGDENDNSKSVYYLYSNTDKKYIEKTPKEIRRFIDGLDTENLEMLEIHTEYKQPKSDELEI